MLEKLVNKPFEYKKLSEEEQKARGILGRLVGVIADTKNPTRNGRHYSEKLWENVFNDPIMQEKIANRCCFGELNHPADRTETDMEKIALCLAEQPKKGKDGRLYGVFDILNTPCGKILKALCDYGCKIGISSRGQGDLIQGYNGEEVDPDTYECECFDAVLVPGVEEARLNYVNEGLERKKSLKLALTESLKSAKTDEELRIMKEQLKEINILTEEDAAEKKLEEKPVNNDQDNAEAKHKKMICDNIDEAAAAKDDKETDDSEEGIEIEDDEEIEEEEPSEESDDINMEDSEKETDETEEIEEPEVEEGEKDDVDIFLDYLANNFKEDQIRKVCKILEIEIEGDEETESEEESETEEETSEEEISTEEEEKSSDDEDIKEEETEETEKTETSEAVDNGSKVLVDSLKEALRAKSNLEAQLRTLQEKLAASDTRVNEANEECNKYKSAISRLSLVAKSSKDAKENVSKLEEALEEKDQIIASQRDRISRLVKNRKASMEQSNVISESVSKRDAEITKLNEDLTSTTQKYTAEISKLNEQLKTNEENSKSQIENLNENLAKATKLKEGYKNLANKAINKYIEIKADTLGITSKDIKRKLGESYTLEDVDQVCEDLKSYQLNVSKLPFSIDKNVSIKGVKVNEAKAVNKTSSKAFDDDSVDDVLFKIANIDE